MGRSPALFTGGLYSPAPKISVLIHVACLLKCLVGQGGQKTGFSGFLNIDFFTDFNRPDLLALPDPYVEVAMVAHMDNPGFIFVDVQNHVVDACLHIFADFVIHVSIHGPFLSPLPDDKI